MSSQLIHEIPKLPDALPKFTVKASIEVTREGGGKRIFEKAVEIDIRSSNDDDAMKIFNSNPTR